MEKQAELKREREERKKSLRGKKKTDVIEEQKEAKPEEDVNMKIEEENQEHND